MRKFSLLKSRTAAVVTGAAVVVGLGTTGAVAADMVGSPQIRNNSIQAEDIRRNAIGGSELAPEAIRAGHIAPGSVDLDSLRPWVQNQLDDKAEINRVRDDVAALGSDVNGNNGLRQLVTQLSGEVTALKEEAAKGYAGPNWSIIDRNVIGAGDAFLRSGPSEEAFGGPKVAPPLGIGSLGIRTASGTDKVAFGNQVDFAGDEVTVLTKLGFSVFTTGENHKLSAGNLPTITFEIDPNLASAPTSNYSSLVFTPSSGTPNAWKTFDALSDADGTWGMTGAAGTATGCVLGACTWADIKTALDDADGNPATIYTVAISKGRDHAFSGAVDALTINDQVFDFEPNGVK